MIRCSQDPAYLAFLAEKGEHALLLEILSIPLALSPDTVPIFTTAEFERHVSRIKTAAADRPDIVRLLNLNLLASCHLTGGRAPFFSGHDLTLGANGTEMPPEALRSGSGSSGWSAIPVFLCLHRPIRRYFIVGALFEARLDNPWPSWADGLLDEACRQAVRHAARCAAALLPRSADTCFFCYPLTPCGGCIQFTGRSLGLPLALGFLSAATGRILSPDLAASGAVTPQGTIEPVAHLDEKAALAAELGYKTFVHAGSGARPCGLEGLPVSSVSEAWLVSRLYAPGKVRDLLLLLRMVDDPRVFVNALDLVEPGWIRWLHTQGRLDRILETVAADPPLFAAFVDKLAQAVNHWDLERAQTLGRVFSSTVPDHLSQNATLSAFRFATQNLALSNHRGDIHSALRWAKRGERLYERARKADLDACAEFMNYRFIMEHNRYGFSPVLSPELKDILGCLEKRHAVQRAGGCVADKTLGGLYGSISQNYGFCGRGYLAECEAYADKATEAFGSGQVAEYREDVFRQFSYKVYARLQAGRLKASQTVLQEYLEIQSWDSLPEALETKRFSRWQHAALARFLAQAPEDPQAWNYLTWAMAHRADRMDDAHPCQLWLWNLGRIALATGERKAATGLFSASLDCCLSAGLGPTVITMALLPLSGLHRLGRATEVATAGERVRETALALNPRHFDSLRNAPFPGMLNALWQAPVCLFPFTYH